MESLIVFIGLVAVCFTSYNEEDLGKILKSPHATLQLYQDFKALHNVHYPQAEEKMRFLKFRKNAAFVATANSDSKNSAKYTLNFFSPLTKEEKEQYFGLNATRYQQPEMLSDVPEKRKPPEEKLWIKEGAVTTVKNQKKCASCWAFAAVAAVETSYFQTSGKLRNFSEQEYLDCVPEGNAADGCKGGWYGSCYKYSVKKGGRLASAANYPYEAKGMKCRARRKKSAMIAAKIKGGRPVGRSESAHVRALAFKGALAVALYATEYFQQYSRGILKDTSCSAFETNHAVTSVGYTAEYFLIKNSWGTDWGDRGFVKLARGHANCGIYNCGIYPVLRKTKNEDKDPSDAATDYDPDEDLPDPQPDCQDKDINCNEKICRKKRIAKKRCRRTCGLCNSCPKGTVKCPDGTCKHEHMC